MGEESVPNQKLNRLLIPQAFHFPFTSSAVRSPGVAAQKSFARGADGLE